MIEPKVSAKAMIFPLTSDGAIYALQNENGEMIRTGTLEVCEVLLHIIDNQNPRLNQYAHLGVGQKFNRAAIYDRR